MPTVKHEPQRTVKNNVTMPVIKSSSILGDQPTASDDIPKVKNAQVTYPAQGTYKGVKLLSPANISTSTSTPIDIVEGGSGSAPATIVVPSPPSPPVMPNLGYGQVLVSGQTTLMANRYMAPITFTAGNNITITTSNGTSTSGGVITITATSNGGGSNTTPGGSNTQLQYNNANSFGGISTVTYNSATNKLSLGNIANINISGGSNGYVMTTDGAGNLSWAASGGGGNATFDTITTTNLIFGGTGPINLDSGNDLNLSAAGNITMNGEPVITLTTLQSVVAAATSFSDFQTLIAAL